MVLLPGWDSVADSAWWAQFWFWTGILCLLGFGTSQLVSHVYGLRKDALVATERMTAESRHRAEVESRRAELELHRAEADTRRAEVQSLTRRLAPPPVQRVDRHVTAEQQRIIAAQLKSWPGLPVSLVLLEDREAAGFGEELVAALQAAGVSVVGLSRRNVLLPAPVGVRVWTRQGDERAAALLGAFAKAQIAVTMLIGQLDTRVAHIVIGVNNAVGTAAR